MDLDEFEDFLISERLLKPATARKRRRLLSHMVKEGFDLDAFCESAEGAEKEKRRLMAKLSRREDITNAGRGNYARVLVGLADFCDHDIKVRYPKAEEADPKAYSRDEFRALRAFRLPRNRDLEAQLRALMEFAYYTAMRPGEVALATMRDLDPAKSRVYVRHPEKGGWQRWLPVEREMWAPTRPFGAWYKRRLAAEAETLWHTYPRGLPPGPASGAQFRNWMNRYVKPATGVDAAMHRFRHTRAVALHDAGLGVLFIKEFLGHRKLETTWNYLRSLVGRMEETFRATKMPGISHAVK